MNNQKKRDPGPGCVFLIAGRAFKLHLWVTIASEGHYHDSAIYPKLGNMQPPIISLGI